MARITVLDKSESEVAAVHPTLTEFRKFKRGVAKAWDIASGDVGQAAEGVVLLFLLSTPTPERLSAVRAAVFGSGDGTVDAPGNHSVTQRHSVNGW